MAKFIVRWKFDSQTVKGGRTQMTVSDARSKAEAIRLAKRRSTFHRKHRRTYAYTAERI